MSWCPLWHQGITRIFKQESSKLSARAFQDPIRSKWTQNIWPFLFCTRLGDLDKPVNQANFFKISNGRKIARMAPILTILGRFRSRRCKLNFAKFSRRQKNFRDDQNVEKLSRKIRKTFPKSLKMLARIRFLGRNKIETFICLSWMNILGWGRCGT